MSYFTKLFLALIAFGFINLSYSEDTNQHNMPQNLLASQPEELPCLRFIHTPPIGRIQNQCNYCMVAIVKDYLGNHTFKYKVPGNGIFDTGLRTGSWRIRYEVGCYK